MDTQDARIIQKVVAPLITKFGPERASEIMVCLSPIIRTMLSWREDIRDDCLIAMLQVLHYAIDEAMEASKAPLN